MADLDQLKQKYSPVIQTIEGFSDLGAKVDSVSLDGDKLLFERFGAVRSSRQSRVGRNQASGPDLLRPAPRNRHHRRTRIKAIA